MTSQRNLWLRLLFVVLVLLSVRSSLAQQSYILGWEGWYVSNASCPCNPDGWDMYIVYGYSTGPGQWVVTNKQYIGHTTYYCSWGQALGTFSSSSGWQNCSAQYIDGCPCAATTMGEPCYIQGYYYCPGGGGAES